LNGTREVITAPHGLDGILAAYGDPEKYLREDGTPNPAWEYEILSRAYLPAPLPLEGYPGRNVQRFACHKRLRPEIEALHGEIFKAGLWDCLVSFAGCFNFRFQRGSADHLSVHCWAAAIDYDYAGNHLGQQGRMDKRIVAIFERRGWTWGGRFARLDAGHFQFCSGY